MSVVSTLERIPIYYKYSESDMNVSEYSGKYSILCVCRLGRYVIGIFI